MKFNNTVLLLGTVQKKEKNNSRMMVYVDTVRGYRNVGDGRRLLKKEQLIVLTNKPEFVDQIDTWEANDVVEIHGEIRITALNKRFSCPNCGEMNACEGTLLFIYPSFIEKKQGWLEEDEAYRILKENREISNQAYLFGVLCRDPKKITARLGRPITQYQLSLEPEYLDNDKVPEINIKCPWVKTYGDNAVEARERLKLKSAVFIDGFLQNRSVLKHHVCNSCGETFDWYDRSVEIVPYETEYIYNIRTEEEIEKERKKLYDQKIKDLFPDDEITVMDIADGFDVM